MRSLAICIATFVIFLASITCLHADPELGLMGFGRTPLSGYTIVNLGMSLKVFPRINKGTLYITSCWKDHGIVEGFEHYDEPLDWWKPTGENIYIRSSVCIGMMFDVPKTDWLSIAPYVGYGTHDTYTQYVSSATGWKFYNRTKRDIYDAGIDIMLYKKYIGVMAGYAYQNKFHYGIFVRY